jgi:hypothetical protein
MEKLAVVVRDRVGSSVHRFRVRGNVEVDLAMRVETELAREQLGKLGKNGCEVGALACREVGLLVGHGDGRNLLVLGLHDVSVVVEEKRLHGVEGCVSAPRRRRLEGERILKPADLLGGKVEPRRRS